MQKYSKNANKYKNKGINKNKVFITALPHNISKRKIIDYFSNFGRIVDTSSIFRIGVKACKSIVIEFSKFKERNSVLNQVHKLNDRYIDCKEYYRGEQLKSQIKKLQAVNVFISGLPETVRGDQLKEALGGFGRVRKVKIGFSVKDGLHYAIASFSSKKEAKEALKVAEFVYNGKVYSIRDYLKVEDKKAGARETQPQSSARNGRGTAEGGSEQREYPKTSKKMSFGEHCQAYLNKNKFKNKAVRRTLESREGGFGEAAKIRTPGTKATGRSSRKESPNGVAQVNTQEDSLSPLKSCGEDLIGFWNVPKNLKKNNQNKKIEKYSSSQFSPASFDSSQNRRAPGNNNYSEAKKDGRGRDFYHRENKYQSYREEEWSGAGNVAGAEIDGYWYPEGRKGLQAGAGSEIGGEVVGFAFKQFNSMQEVLRMSRVVAGNHSGFNIMIRQNF